MTGGAGRASIKIAHEWRNEFDEHNKQRDEGASQLLVQNTSLELGGKDKNTMRTLRRRLEQ